VYVDGCHDQPMILSFVTSSILDAIAFGSTHFLPYTLAYPHLSPTFNAIYNHKRKLTHPAHCSTKKFISK